MVGQINLILGCMFSSKTSTLISRYNRYSIGGKTCIMIKYRHDDRYDPYKIVTHDGIKVEAYICEFLKEVDKLVANYEVICVDEVQFYKDADYYLDKWANEGKIIEACGLNGDFNREPFEIINHLIPKVEDITFLKAICRKNGNNAVFSKRLINSTEKEVIGGEESYEAVDRENYFT